MCLIDWKLFSICVRYVVVILVRFGLMLSDCSSRLYVLMVFLLWLVMRVWVFSVCVVSKFIRLKCVWVLKMWFDRYDFLLVVFVCSELLRKFDSFVFWIGMV